MAALENARQERFCQALCRGLPAIRAYAEAGYAPNNSGGSELLDNPRVAARFLELQLEAAHAARITRASILVRLDKTADRCMQAEPVLDHEGKETGEYKFNATGAVAALKQLAEMIPAEADAGDRDAPKPNASPEAVAATILRIREQKRGESAATH